VIAYDEFFKFTFILCSSWCSILHGLYNAPPNSPRSNDSLSDRGIVQATSECWDSCSDRRAEWSLHHLSRWHCERSIALPATNDYYEFGASGAGDITIRHLDPTTYTATGEENHQHEEAATEVANASDLDGIRPLAISAQSLSSGDSRTAADLIDTVAGYGRDARALAAVDRANLAFANSQIQDVELELLANIEDPDYSFPGNVAGIMGSSDELGSLNATSDDRLNAITDLKSELGADHFAFIVKEPQGSAAGIAYYLDTSMTVTRDYMSSTGLIFAHELGHHRL
jgi:hypothetical protein